MASWRPARTRVSCPECGQQRLPTIRSTADRYSSSAAGAAWVMTCWPFCFLPCLFTSPTKHHLHCSGCDAYLGLYDPDREVVGVNRKVRRTVRYREVESKRWDAGHFVAKRLIWERANTWCYQLDCIEGCMQAKRMRHLVFSRGTKLKCIAVDLPCMVGTLYLKKLKCLAKTLLRTINILI